MITVVVTEEFEKRFRLLPIAIQRKATKQETLFRSNPFHPSLNTEKLIPKAKQAWSFRVDRSYRVIFRFDKPNTATFLTVGPHSWIYRF